MEGAIKDIGIVRSIVHTIQYIYTSFILLKTRRTQSDTDCELRENIQSLTITQTTHDVSFPFTKLWVWSFGNLC